MSTSCAFKASLSTAAVTLALAWPAHAQETANTPAPAARHAETLEVDEIIVTARRREERLQDVPISITVFDQQQLSNKNVVNAGDLATYTPSLTTNARFGAESTSFAIRGFIQEGPTSPSVAVYFADVVGPRAQGGTTAGNGAGPGNFFDLQNVQVLKGPQGTLFGRNTTGGAVLLVPQKPTSEFGGYGEVSVGNYDLRRYQAVLNLPVSDTFRLRLGVDDNSRDGYLKNVAPGPGLPVVGPKDFADVNYTAGRLSAVWDVSSNIENYTIASWSDSDTHGGMVPKMAVALPLTRGNPTYRFANYQAQVDALSDDFWDVSSGHPNARQHIKSWQVINTTTWMATDTMTFKNIVSYAEFRQRQASTIFGDSGPTAGIPTTYHYAVSLEPGPGKYNVAQSTFTEELQLQGRVGDKFNYQTGLYFEEANPLNGFQTTYSANFLNCTDVVGLQCTDVLGTLSGAPGSVGAVTISRSKYTFRNRGIYAQGTYEFTDQWSLTAGLRYTSDDTWGHGSPLKVTFPTPNSPRYNCANPKGVVTGGTPAEVLADPSLCDLKRKASSDKPTWMVDLDYKPIDDVLLYAKYSRGYRQGNVNVSSYGLETWGPEKVETYEVGSKLSFQSFISGNFNIAAFYNDFSDQQLQLSAIACTAGELVSNPTQCPFIPASAAGIANAGKSTIKGVEVESNLSLFEGFNLNLSYAYLDTKIKEIETGRTPPGFSRLVTAPAGGPIPLTPKHKYAITGSYTLPLGENIGRITLESTYTHQSSTFGVQNSLTSGLSQLPKQNLLNANINWSSIAGSTVDLSLFGTNLRNKEFWTFTTGTSFGFDSIFVNQPRMYGARVRYRFGN